jgi:phage terminase large subunit-like protein
MSTKTLPRRPAAKDPQLRPPPGVVTTATRPVVLRVEPDKRRRWRAWVDYRDGQEPREFYTAGPFVIRFIENFCVCTDGQWVNQPMVLLDWQKDWLIEAFELEAETGLRRYREVLLGVPKKNGKSGLIAAVALYLLGFDAEPAAKVVVAGAGEESANNVFAPARSMVIRDDHAKEPGILSRTFVPWDEEIVVAEDTESKIFRVAGSPKQTEGKNLSHVIIDEWHEWDIPRLEQNATKLINGTVTRRQPLVLKITTPGWNLQTLCGQDYEYGTRVAAGEVEDRRFFFRWFEAPKELDWRSEAFIAAANPSYPHLMTWAFYEDKLSGRQPEPESNYRRYFGGQWSGTQDTWLPPGTLAACVAPELQLIPGAPTCLGIDASSRYDSTSVTAGQRQVVERTDPETGEPVKQERHVFRSWIWERPLNPHTRKPDMTWVFPWEEEIMPLIWRLIGEYDVWSLQFDQAYFTHEAQAIADRWDPERVNEFFQGGKKMEEASQGFYSICVNRIFAYDGDPAYTRHLESAAAVQSSSGRAGWRLVKGRASSFMDAAVSTAMCNWAIENVPNPVKPKGGVSVYIPGEETEGMRDEG